MDQQSSSDDTPTPEGKRTLVITTEVGKNRERQYEVVIDEEWKVTFGPFSPGSQRDGGNCLRIYETKEKQRACIRGVVSFHDRDHVIIRPTPRQLTRDLQDMKERFDDNIAQRNEEIQSLRQQLAHIEGDKERERVMADPAGLRNGDVAMVVGSGLVIASSIKNPDPDDDMPF